MAIRINGLGNYRNPRYLNVEGIAEGNRNDFSSVIVPGNRLGSRITRVSPAARDGVSAARLLEDNSPRLDFDLFSPPESGDPLEPCSAQYRARNLSDLLKKSPSRGETFFEFEGLRKTPRVEFRSDFNHGGSDLNIDEIFGEPQEDDFREDLIFPRHTIKQANITANRELILINNYAFDRSSPLDTIQRREDNRFVPIAPRAALPPVNLIPQNKAREKADPFRFVSGRVWCFREGEETMVSADPLQQNPFGALDGTAGAEANASLGIPFHWSIPANLERFNGNVSVSQLQIQFDSSMCSLLTNQFDDFDGSYEKFLDVYMRGASSEHYDGSKHSRYSLGLLPTRLNVYVDQVFSAEAPFFEQEMDIMNVSQFTNVSISAKVHNYEEEDRVYKGLPAEYSKPSIYRVYNDTVLNGALTACPKKDKIQKFPCSKVSLFDEINKTFKDTFDKYVSISINTQQALKIASFLHEEKMDKYILEMVTGWVPPARARPTTSEGKTRQSFFPGMVPGAFNDIFTEVIDESVWNPWGDGYQETLFRPEASQNDRFINDVTRRTWTGIDALFSMEGILSHSFKNKLRQYPLHIDRYDRNYPEGSHRLIKFWDSISSQIFMARTDSFVQTESLNRTLGDILNGEKAYSEIVGYKICKYRYGPKGVIEEPIQEFYVMDSDSITTIDFIDTQVLCGSKYLYRIFSLNFVLASAYTLVNKGKLLLEGKTLQTLQTADFATRPIAYIIEAPFFEQEVTVSEAPPMAPTVSFLPYEGDDEHIRILIEASTGQSLESPVMLLGADKTLMKKMMSSNNPDSESRILYSADNNPTHFQVFRVDEEPQTGLELQDIFGDNSENNPLGQKMMNLKGENYAKIVESQGRNAFVSDVLKRNKYYYYIFRAIDAAGISNPTNYFKVRLVSYENGIFLEVESIELHSEDEPATVNFERFIEIKPSKHQEALWFGNNVDYEDRNFYRTVPDKFDLGHVRGNSVWGRRFKLRIKSLSSKKSVDINFRFSKKFHFPPPKVNPRGRGVKPCPPDNGVLSSNDGVIEVMRRSKPKPIDSKKSAGLGSVVLAGQHYRARLPFGTGARMVFPSSSSEENSDSSSSYVDYDNVGNYVKPWFMGK